MNIINQLTLRQLRLNKRRTLITILGTIISVAMITAVMVSAASGVDLLKRVTISNKGNWHMRYHNLKADQINALQQDENIEEIILDYSIGYVPLENPKYSQKPYLFVRAYNENAFTQLPIELVEGQLPKNSGEIVIPEHLKKSTGIDYRIGDTIELELGQRYQKTEEEMTSPQPATQDQSLIRDENNEIKETFIPEQTKTYKVVGVIKKSREEQSWSPGYELLTYVDQEELSEEAVVTASVLLKHLNKDIYEHNEALGRTLGVSAIEPNSMLLACYGVNSETSLMTALWGIVGIVMMIIMIGSISLIYNAFAISVAERAQYLGMLASVGATKKQKRASVLFEGVVIGTISIPLGLLVGLLGMSVTFKFVNTLFKEGTHIQEDLKLVILPITLLGVVLISMFTLFVSSYIPARRASKMTSIEAIKQTTDIKITQKQIKTSRFTRKIFGFEGELALKNLKRQGRRYRAIVFSLAMSMILFLATSSFSAYMTKTIDMLIATTNYDVRVSYWNQEGTTANLGDIKNLEHVENYNLIRQTSFQTYVSEAVTPEFIKQMIIETGSDIKEDGCYYTVYLMGMADEAFKTYVQSIGGDINQFEVTKEPAAVLINRAKFTDKKTKAKRDEEVIYLQIGEQISLIDDKWLSEEEWENVEVGKMSIGAITKEPPLGVEIQEDSNQLQLVVSQSTYNTVVKQAAEILERVVSSYEAMYLTSDDPFALQQEIEALSNHDASNTYSIYNVYEQKQSKEQMQLVLQVFIYGFVALITLVSVANIFNTISTSIALRKREFAMLRSVGMTSKSFNQMIYYESIFYGVKAFVYGLPISLFIMRILYNQLSQSFTFDFFIPVKSVIIAVSAIFIIVGMCMFYSSSKIKEENIVEGLKDSNL